VQVNENYRQSGYKKVWDMVLSIIGNCLQFKIYMWTPCYTFLVITSVFQQVQVGLNISRLSFT